MKIGLLLLAAGRRAGGPETYEVQLVQGLQQLDRTNEYHVYCTEQSALELFGTPQPNFKFHVLPPSLSRTFALAVSLPILLKQHGIDLLHCTYAPPPFSPVPYVFTFHCLSNLVHPEFYGASKVFRLNQLQKRGLRSAKRVICVSRFVADGARDLLNVAENRLDVIYNGVGSWFQPVPKQTAAQLLSDELGIDSPYILYVGKLQARKNIARLVRAFQAYREKCGGDTKLVLLGRRTETSESIDEAIAQAGLHSSIHHIDYLQQSEDAKRKVPLMGSLYSNAEMFVFPSLYEGFGIPVLEAMACGTPVIASNTTSLPEVAGDAALLVDPESEEDLANAMIRLGTSLELKQQLSAAGLRRAEEFSWLRCAEQTRDIYFEFAGNGASAHVHRGSLQRLHQKSVSKED